MKNKWFCGKWVRRLAFVVLLLVVIVLVLVVGARQSPRWYQGAITNLSDPAASAAEDQFVNLRNWAAACLAARNRHESSPGPFVLDLTAEQINSLLFRWLSESGAEQRLAETAGFKGLAVRIQPGSMTFAARPIKADWLTASLTMTATLAPGELRIAAGVPRLGLLPLPLPDALTVGRLAPVLADARRRYGAKATLTSKGFFNDEAAVACGIAIAQASLGGGGVGGGRASEPVVLLPIDGRRSVAAEVTGLELIEGRVRVTLTSRAAAKDAALLARLRDSAK